MQIDSYAQGVPCWSDVPCPNASAAGAFYSALLGWDVPEGNPDFGGYRSATLNDRTVAGLYEHNEGSPVVWATYFASDDADATAAEVEANGGVVMMPPMDVGPLGRMGVFVDPTGAVFGVWQAGEHKGAGVRDVPGAPCWNELITTDPAAAKAFYSAVFGWTWSASSGNEGYQEFIAAGMHCGGMMPKPEMMPAELPSHWGVYFTVADADAAAAQAVELGGELCVAPMDIPNVGRMAVVFDPNGAVFNVVALFPQAS